MIGYILCKISTVLSIIAKRLSGISESLSIFLDKSGRGKKILLAACKFPIEHALKI